MSFAEFATELAAASQLARAAGRAALAHYGTGVAVTYKSGDSGPVTAADKEANALIVAGLRRAFPDDAILAEESADSHAPGPRRHKARLWCIDPIDGTRDFVEQTGQWVIMLGLAVDGAARLGVVYDPLTDTLWQGALAGDGTGQAEVTQRGVVRDLRVSAEAAGPQARLVVSRHGYGKAVAHVCTRLGVHRRQTLGSVGLKMAWLASGQAEIYVCATDRIHEWDTCGPEAIVRAAGGTVTDLFGGPLRYNKADTHTTCGMLASNGPMHGALLAAVDEAAVSGQAPTLQRMRGRAQQGPREGSDPT